MVLCHSWSRKYLLCISVLCSGPQPWDQVALETSSHSLPGDFVNYKIQFGQIFSVPPWLPITEFINTCKKGKA